MTISDEPFPPSVRGMFRNDAITIGREITPDDLERVLIHSDNAERASILKRLASVDDGNMRQQANLRVLKRRLSDVHGRMQRAGR